GLALAGLVHDVGWTLMPDGEPNPGEHAQAAEHLLGLRGATGGLAAEAVRAHHERWDGRGGPLGLVGAEIPVLARALAVVDRADQARRSPAERPPGPAVILLAEAGGALDPALVRAWLALSARRDDGWSP
ncbi:MAG: HD domain-containing protein, partial [Myxococcales bacterium]|nr:HD domain-containing protein [Myxococcales bacterium]